MTLVRLLKGGDGSVISLLLGLDSDICKTEEVEAVETYSEPLKFRFPLQNFGLVSPQVLRLTSSKEFVKYREKISACYNTSAAVLSNRFYHSTNFLLIFRVF